MVRKQDNILRLYCLMALNMSLLFIKMHNFAINNVCIMKEILIEKR